MGTKCAPPYSCVYMGYIENNKIIPLSEYIRFWKRFIDDIFFIFLGSLSELMSLFEQMNNMHPNLKFTFKYSQSKIDFLDATVHIDSEGELSSSLYTKPTDTSALLHFSSFHPLNTKKSIIYSQALRYRMLITNNNTLAEELNKLKTTLIYRGYPKKMIEKEFSKISQLSQLDVLTREKQNTSKKLVFTIQHTRHKQQLKQILTKHWHFIENDPELNTLWDKPPTIAIKRHNNLKDILVRAKTRPSP